MSRYRLVPSPSQETVLRGHCAHPRIVWNLAVEQQSWYGRAGRQSAPGWVAQARQLTDARAENAWLAAGSQMVQQQALRAKSYRVTLDRAGRWHIAFAAVPAAIPGPGTGEVVGVDRGVAVSAALSTGELLNIPRLSPGRQARLRRMQRQLARARRGSNRRTRVKRGIAPLKGREADARKDVNAARNIAAGHAVTARRGDRVTGPAKREPQELLLAS